MKKITTTLLIVFSFCTITRAQLIRSNFEFGAEIGYNNSYIIANNGYGSSFIGGFNAGVSADYYFTGNWSLKAKLNYDQKGWGDGYLIDQTGNQTNHVDYQLNYLTLPVMANWHFGRTQNLYVDFGPYIGLLLSASEDYDNSNVKQYFNTVDAGIAAGVGIKFPITPNTQLFLEYETQGSLANINSDGNGQLLQNVRESFNVGINF
jgi:hypothetical protein